VFHNHAQKVMEGVCMRGFSHVASE